MPSKASGKDNRKMDLDACEQVLKSPKTSTQVAMEYALWFLNSLLHGKSNMRARTLLVWLVTQSNHPLQAQAQLCWERSVSVNEEPISGEEKILELYFRMLAPDRVNIPENEGEVRRAIELLRKFQHIDGIHATFIGVLNIPELAEPIKSKLIRRLEFGPL